MFEVSQSGTIASLFVDTMYQISKQLKELEDHFNVARNLACSDLSSSWMNGDRIDFDRLYPEQMDKLHNNFNLMREYLSFQRYLAIKVYLPHLKSKTIVLEEDWSQCYEYWEEKLKGVKPSKKFELKDRFEEAA